MLLNSRLILAFFISTLAHFLLFFLAWYWLGHGPLFKSDAHPIRVSIARLGELRDPNLLPRVDASRTPPAPVIRPKPSATPAAMPKTEKRVHNPLDILKKRFGEPNKAGLAKGVAAGDSMKEDLAYSYEAQVLALLRDNYEIPHIIGDKEAKRLHVWVRIWIDRNGELTQIKVQNPSKNPRFDRAVLEGSRKISSFGAPPLPLVKKYQKEGLLIQFCPMECL